MIKKIYNKIRSFFFYIFWGLKSADKIAFGTKEDSSNAGTVLEQQNEQNSVYKDLLKGEVTQEVKELRHEMYFSERKSHKYKYIGNGVVTKKNEIFDYPGKIDKTDGFPLQILQPNIEDTGTLSENLSEKDYRIKNKKEFTIDIERDFIPRFRLEEFTNKLVVKRINENAVMLDFYTPIYKSQFNTIHKLFLKELEKIYMGDVRSDVIDFKQVEFISFRAFGTDDLKKYTYNNIEFDNILIFDGHYVIKFTADIVNDGEDLINEFYCKEEEEKSRMHAPRNENGQTIDFLTALYKAEDKYDYEQAKELIGDL